MTRTKRNGIVAELSLAALSLSMGFFCTTAAEGIQSGVKIIVHPEVDVASLSKAELSRIYLGKKTFWESGARISPSLLDEKSPVTETFLEENLKKTVRQYRAYWKRHLFSGQGTAPKTFSSSKLVADFVVANPGAIGIVDASFSDDRVKVVELQP